MLKDYIASKAATKYVNWKGRATQNQFGMKINKPTTTIVQMIKSTQYFPLDFAVVSIISYNFTVLLVKSLVGYMLVELKFKRSLISLISAKVEKVFLYFTQNTNIAKDSFYRR